MEHDFDWTGAVAERRIKDAMDAGQFNDLPGKGQPLDLESNPFEPAHMRVANRILKNARALPPWLQLEKDIQQEIALLGSRREKALAACRGARNDAARQRIVARFRDEHRERMDTLNTMILHYNEISPAAARRTFAPYRIAKEMAALDADFVASRRDSA
jgi:hypothetical protein